MRGSKIENTFLEISTLVGMGEITKMWNFWIFFLLALNLSLVTALLARACIVRTVCGDGLWKLSVETVCGDSLNSLLRTGDYSRWKTIFSSFYELDQIILKIRMILRRKNDKIIWNIMRISLSL